MIVIFWYIYLENAFPHIILYAQTVRNFVRILQIFDETFTLLLQLYLTLKYYIDLHVFAYWFLTYD